MTIKYNSLTKKVFSELLESAKSSGRSEEESQDKTIVRSINEFLGLLYEANNIYNTTFDIIDSKRLIFSEEYPADRLFNINNQTKDEAITNKTLDDIRVITFLANERPATLSARTINNTGIQNIKWRFAGLYEDPKFTGYSILRQRRDVEAEITFKVWGRYFHDIRERATMLKDIIDTNTWYFAKKGLKRIQWLGSYEEEMWDNKNIAKFKTQKYLIEFTEIKETKEKNLEQIVVSYGLE